MNLPNWMDAKLKAKIEASGCETPGELVAVAEEMENYAKQLRAAANEMEPAFAPLQWLLDGCEKPLEEYTAPKAAKKPRKPKVKKAKVVWDLPKRMNLN